MNRLAIAAIVLATFAAGCGSTTPSTPSSTNPTQVKFTASILPANEVPAITNAENTGRGTATVTLNLTRDAAGAITAATADLSVDVTGFPAGTPINIMHVHNAAAGVNGGIVIQSGLAAGEIVLVNGSQNGIARSGISVTPTLAQDIITNPANYYYNIHTTINAGGVARGQLVKQ
jgi:CHRD domain